MSSHGGHSHADGEAVCVPSVSLETANELSWMLGERTVDDDRTKLLAEWRMGDTRQLLSLFEVTSETALLRYRSPVGREHYLGTTLSRADRVRSDLDASADWDRVEK